MHQSLISSTAHVCKVPNLLLYTKLTTNGAGFATIKLINVKRTINPRQKLFQSLKKKGMCSRLFLMTLHLKSLHVQNNFRKIHTIGNPLRYMTKQMCAMKNSPLSTFCKLHTHCLPSIIYWATSPWKILLPQQNQTCKLLIIHLLAQHKYSIKKQKICRRKKKP